MDSLSPAGHARLPPPAEGHEAHQGDYVSRLVGPAMAFRLHDVRRRKGRSKDSTSYVRRFEPVKHALDGGPARTILPQISEL